MNILSYHSGKQARREKQTRYLSQAIQLEEAVNPHIIRSTMTMISLAILIFLLWAGFTSISEIARTAGEVVPQGYQQTVQHLEGGSIKQIHVQEGDMVKAGNALITLHESGISEDVRRLQKQQNLLEMKKERLVAFAEGREPNFFSYAHATEEVIRDQQALFESMRHARREERQILTEQIKEKQQMVKTLESSLLVARQNYALAREVYNRRQELGSKGYASQISVLESKQRVNDLLGEITTITNQIAVAKTSMVESETRLASLAAIQKEETLKEIASVEAEMAQNEEVLNKLKVRMDRLVIRAPADGLVKGLAVNTIGSVVQPGTTIMEIVPMGKDLEVQVKISPQDIGHLEIGQPVNVKFSSYDFSRYGLVSGTLEHISATTFVAEDGSRYYRGRIRLQKDYVGDNPQNVILPGMTVMADIITGEKTILQYMLKPVHVAVQTAFSER